MYGLLISHIGVEEEQLYAEAITNDSTLSLRYLKLVTLGPGQVGKSTFVYRLLGLMKWDIQSAPEETHPKFSTGQGDLRDVCIKYDLETAALGNNDSWTCLKGLTGQVDVLTTLLSIKQIEDSVSVGDEIEVETTSSQSYPLPISVPIQAHQDIQNNLTKVQGVNTKPEPDSIEQPHATPVDRDSVALEAKIELSGPSTTVKDFKELLKKNISEQIVTNTLCNVIDVGGQPAFLDMLPLLNIGPAMHLVFTKLLDGLTSEYPVLFKSEFFSDTIECNEYSYTTEEVVFAALASVSCFGKSDAEVDSFIEPTKNAGKSTDSLALLMGTFEDEYLKAKDECDEETFEDDSLKAELKLLDVEKKEEKLIKQLKDANFYKNENDGLIKLQDPETSRVFFRINNLHGGEKEIIKYRKHLQEFIDSRFRKYKIPVKWLQFSICLKMFADKSKITHSVTFDECVELGKHFLMEEKQVKLALHFFHKYLGLMMYFPKNNELKDCVICNPQIVLQSISELIFSVYDKKNSKIPDDKYERFVNYGQFSLDDVKTEKKGLLPIEKLVKLLEHLNISAHVLSSEEYFIPAVLKNVKTIEIADDWSTFEPLFIRFQTGYVPLGFVCALLANLIAREEFELANEPCFKNKIEMNIKGMCKITLLSCLRYIKVLTKSQDSDNCIDHFKVQKMLCESADQVIDAMQHGSVYKVGVRLYDLAFTCPKCSMSEIQRFGSEKLAVVVEDTSGRKSLQCTDSIPNKKEELYVLTPKMNVWIDDKEVKFYVLI